VQTPLCYPRVFGQNAISLFGHVRQQVLLAIWVVEFACSIQTYLITQQSFAADITKTPAAGHIQYLNI
jgi:hypothetical protein